MFRKFLGPELVIVILTMPRKDVKKRLEKRYPKIEDKATIDFLMVKFFNIHNIHYIGF